jgi:hypothetical protein
LLLGISTLKAQTKPQAAAASAVQPLDASNLREPMEIGARGLVQAGDNPAWAQPDFDDSKWLQVDAKTPLSAYFPENQQPILWRRIRIKVDPEESHLAVQTYYLSNAYEVYVNGQRLMESGQVDPFVPYTREARMIAPIPDAQARSSSR